MQNGREDVPEEQDEWTVESWGNRNSVLRFRSDALSSPPLNPPARDLHMTYKVVQADVKLVAATLNAHGLIEVAQDVPDFNLLWTATPPKPETYTTLTAYQRINHFPRSYELTRKDRLSQNIGKYQRSKWSKLFDFVPQSFVLPTDYGALCAAHKLTRRPWIVKPIASSRGRGINIVNHLADIPTNENVVVAKYVDNPLLVDGRKCDVRLYVAVTSFNPLVVYVYEEGLVRFATVKYQPGGQQLWNLCMHLCNYSLNKYHSDYVVSSAEDGGHKWTLSALLQHLRSRGSDTAALMQGIEELIVKSLLAVALPVASAVKMFVPHKRNCFEVYGFDVLIDDALKPWLLEVNYSPSLGCDSQLDTRVKSAMLADLLTLAGLPTVDPALRPRQNGGRALSQDASRGGIQQPSRTTSISEVVPIARLVRDEFKRRGGFVRIFPAQDSWERYGSFLDPTSGFFRDGLETRTHQPFTLALFSHNHNRALHRALFPRSQDTTGDLAGRLAYYERVLVHGHDLDFESGDPSAQKSTQMVDYRSDVIQSLHEGRRLNQWQARRMFAQYLSYVLGRVTGRDKEKGDAELVIKFLQRVSVNLRAPYTIQPPSARLKGKDRDAVVAKRLYDFLAVYSRETDLHADRDVRSQFVDERTFRPFIERATETDVDDVLSLNARLYRDAHLYLGRCGAGVKSTPALTAPYQDVHTSMLSSVVVQKKTT